MNLSLRNVPVSVKCVRDLPVPTARIRLVRDLIVRHQPLVNRLIQAQQVARASVVNGRLNLVQHTPRPELLAHCQTVGRVLLHVFAQLPIRALWAQNLQLLHFERAHRTVQHCLLAHCGKATLSGEHLPQPFSTNLGIGLFQRGGNVHLESRVHATTELSLKAALSPVQQAHHIHWVACWVLLPNLVRERAGRIPQVIPANVRPIQNATDRCRAQFRHLRRCERPNGRSSYKRGCPSTSRSNASNSEGGGSVLLPLPLRGGLLFSGGIRHPSKSKVKRGTARIAICFDEARAPNTRR